MAAALDLVESRDLPAPWLVGWSFGSDLALRYGCDPSVVGAVLISPPLRFSTDADLHGWAESGRPLTAIVPELDDYLRPAAARAGSPRPAGAGRRRTGREAPVRRVHRGGARRGGGGGAPGRPRYPGLARLAELLYPADRTCGAALLVTGRGRGA